MKDIPTSKETKRLRQILAALKDGIFDGLPKTLRKEWPLKFARAVSSGSDLSKVWAKFAVFLLTDKVYGVIHYAKTDDQKKVIQKTSDLYAFERNVTSKEWDNIISTVYAVTEIGEDTRNVFFTTIRAINANSRAVGYAARAAADSSGYAALASGDYEKHRIAQSEKLLELLSECQKENS